jgi:SAM-dependent methyltransferase
LKPEEYQIMYEVEDSLWWYKGMESIMKLIIERYYAPAQGLRILDAGCGTGAGLRTLAAYGDVTGIDLSPHALRFSRQREETRLIRGSITSLPFRQAVFDLVTSFDVLCVKGVDDKQALQEFRRVLAPGGRVILRLPAYNWLRGTHDQAVDIGHRYTAREIRTRLTELNLVIEHTSYANMWLFPVAVCKRWSDRFFSGQGGSDLNLRFGFLNRIFRTILASEASYIAWRGLPFGLSVVAVGRKD